MGETTTTQPLCAKEALDLLNCAAGADFDRDKCLHFLDALRHCVLQNKVKKFSVADQIPATEAPKSKEKP